MSVLRTGLVVLGITATLVAGRECGASNEVYLGRVVAADRQLSMDRIDHSAWDVLLKRYVDRRGDVAYGRWQRSSQDVAALDAYLATLSTANPSLRCKKTAALAFWINAYNAVTIRGILREYPTSSIRDHTPKLWGYNIWKDLQLYVGGRPYSLTEIEHDVLRKMREPRIHFAIVCASRSCPRLRDEAYTAARMGDQLIANTREFFAADRHFRYDRASREFQVSSILKWFAEDFGRDKASQLRTIAPYLPDRNSYEAAMAGDVSISYLPYDWSLNDAR